MTDNVVAQVERAFEIADEAMFELLCGHGVQLDSNGCTWGMTNEQSVEVTHRAEASTAIADALDWLIPRGYVEVLSDAEGEFVAVIRRPGE